MKKPTGPTLFEIPDEPEDDEPRYNGTPVHFESVGSTAPPHGASGPAPPDETSVETVLETVAWSGPSRGINGHHGGAPTIAVARSIGELEAARVGAKAERVDPGFLRSARAAMLVELERGARTGEQLADACKAQGIKPHDDRAFGSVIRELSRDKVIEAVGFAARRKGHGTAGGRVWSLKAC